ncbi:alpha/beta-hydrolase [Aspergillus fijiensis CBS 313.89]|uniref:Carboxypeptidase n=1 Tax=Aspergillus fijiensis CBS 313.89 TaxID=1448319 RepID=A0A8G1W3X1_9EURO|nr:alpha/beta-hydrolase [Aspergillus fijiensis CBS 313.89]RAK82006.1 alpha/beta-hydrolase [Aspergillus fijiensis CBS 313.89]
MLLPSFSVTGVAIALLLLNAVHASQPGSSSAHKARAYDRFSTRPARNHAPRVQSSNTSTYRFWNDRTKPHLVESLPDVHFDLGELYSGSISISSHQNESRSLFYIFQPKIGEPSDDLTIYLNGGPGCSSEQAFFQENGRFTWQPGTYAPVINQYSWVNLTNMLWVDQPVGTGYSVGTPTATNEAEVAADFLEFFTKFQDLYGIKNFRIFVSGESYAGRYVPYISSAMLDKNDTTHFNLSGALLYDACIGQWDWVQAELPAYPFVQQHASLFNFNETFMTSLATTYEECGYQAYFDEYFTFPAAGIQPPKYMNYSECDIYNAIYYEAFTPNPCFNPYRIIDECPLLWDVLGFPTDLAYEPAPTTYFNRADVKRALHAPHDIEWELCSSDPVFVGGDAVSGPEQQGDDSPNPTEGVLPRVIEATNRVLIANGDWDYLIITNGTLLAIQNMTWHGRLGFAAAPATPIDIRMPDLQWAGVFDAQEGYGELDGPQGVVGVQHYERGLMWAETFQAGHKQAQDQGRVSYRHLQWLLGEVDRL